MTIDSPILGLAAVSLAALIRVLTRRTSRWPRWLLRTAAGCAAVAVAGVGVAWHRPPHIVVMVDVSPSTRSATFGDTLSVSARLTPLLAGRPYTLRYFANGLAEGPENSNQLRRTDPAPNCTRTRLEVPPDAEAVVLLSDGRFDAPASLPPVYAIVDPALNAPTDARVRDVRQSDGPDGPVLLDVVGDGVRPLIIEGATPRRVSPQRGPALIAVRATGGPVAAHFAGTPADAWPENDALTFDPIHRPAARWAVGIGASGFTPKPDLPAELASFGNVAAVVVSTRTKATAARAAALTTFVRDWGGTLVLAGRPDAAASAVRALSPLDTRPPRGPQRWIVLLDASGSMATPVTPRRTRWDVARDAAATAIDRLPAAARVDVMAFAGGVRTIAAAASPADAGRRLAEEVTSPSGPTGLRAALLAVAAQASTPTRLMALTDGDADLGDVDALAATLRAADVTLDAVAATPADALARLCTTTGGRATVDIAPAHWAAALGDVLVDAGESPVPAGIARGEDRLADRSLAFARNWRSFLKTGGVAQAAADAQPIVAMWQCGLGRVVAVSCDLSPDDLAAVATTFERPAVDPRFSVLWDEGNEVVRLTAVDAGRPVNGLRVELRRDGAVTAFGQTGPGTYAAALPRAAEATMAVVAAQGEAVERRSLAGRYPAEFDAIGNDRAALQALAARTGGAVVAAGDQRPLALADRTQMWPLGAPAAGAAAVLLLISVFGLRR